MKKQFTRGIELTVDNVNNKIFYFTNDPVLQDMNAVIERIESFRVANVATSPKTGNAIVADAIFNKAFLTLVVLYPDGEERVSKMPLSMVCRADNNGVVPAINIKGINVQKSYIELSSIAGLVVNTVFYLVAHYTK